MKESVLFHQVTVKWCVDMVKIVGFEVLTAMSVKISSFWFVAQCVLIKVHQHFRALVMEAARTSEKFVNLF
jgi:hypothetical protein